MLGDYNGLSGDIRKAYALGDQIDLPRLKSDVDHIFFIGMGGSAIGGDILKLFLEDIGWEKSISIIRDYKIPKTMTKNSLVFAVSYSGNSEETLGAYREAIRVTDNVIAISSGGKLEETVSLNRRPFLKIPKGMQPRVAALSYLFFPILKILENYKIIQTQIGTVNYLTTSLSSHDVKGLAFGLSEKLVGKIILSYASEKYFPLAYRFKTQMNENAKVHAFASHYSEFNHNELAVFEENQEQYHAVTFRCDDDHRRVLKRMDLVKEMMQKSGGSTTEIKLSGREFLTKLFTGLIIGDLISIFVALRRGKDPSEIKYIERFKEKMGPYISN